MPRAPCSLPLTDTSPERTIGDCAAAIAMGIRRFADDVRKPRIHVGSCGESRGPGGEETFGLAPGRGRETTAVNIVPGCADPLKAELQLREPSVWVGVPPSGGIRTGSTDRLKAELQLPESLVFRGIPGFGRCSPQWSGDPRRTRLALGRGRETRGKDFAAGIGGEAVSAGFPASRSDGVSPSRAGHPE